MTISNGSTKVSGHRSGSIKTSSIELFDISILYLPSDITCIVGTVSFSDTLHGSTTHNAEASTIDIALSIVSVTGNVATIEAREIEFVIITTSHRNWRVFGRNAFILVTTRVEFLEPRVSSYMDIRYFI